MASVLVPLAEGCEEIEAVIIIDTLRRAGWEVVPAGLTTLRVRASRGVRLEAETTWDQVGHRIFDVLALPGGAAGTEALARDQRVIAAVRTQCEAGRIVAAICAAPLVLQAAGILNGRRATCHPGVAGQLTATRRCNERVVVDGPVVTSQGPGTAFEFALTLIRLCDGAAAAEKVASGLIL